jgi:hypothetical protein
MVMAGSRTVRIGDAAPSACDAEWTVLAGATPPIAAHVVTPRAGYTHHGIYVGNGKVVHYRGLSRGLRAGPVEEIPLAEFAAGHPVRVRAHHPARFDCGSVIARARSRIGENSYRIFSNNCEHFVEWCVQGRSRSLQIEAFCSAPRRALLYALRFLLGGLYRPPVDGNTTSVAA